MKNKMTIEKFKEKYDEAVEEVLKDPVKGLKNEKEIDCSTQVMMMMTGVILFRQLKKRIIWGGTIEWKMN